MKVIVSRGHFQRIDESDRLARPRKREPHNDAGKCNVVGENLVIEVDENERGRRGNEGELDEIFEARPVSHERK